MAAAAKGRAVVAVKDLMDRVAMGFGSLSCGVCSGRSTPINTSRAQVEVLVAVDGQDHALGAADHMDALEVTQIQALLGGALDLALADDVQLGAAHV